ncbi:MULTISPECIES: GNAT family N-acetyltransferase [unclassified Rhizobium]|uniref:GNAT family N-acetyltransferase n=1 Tax=unclassified Rhizobium TaxID=2613769 RepID=UPI0016163EFF|nr:MULTISPECIES: GNAT family N-acetyltransferase [unclassified Rhizobium]MBB3541977.1 GNAT superfamily N-acetyltransferase [Rhizobium sp. BK399]MCS3740442.1 GNAT superfamily N-acetyltransferase [Rhizobium sp. BK661]MCS4094364.1 GNAT superfamily N-acetyltransferase [Rhizobium sp. BK176]
MTYYGTEKQQRLQRQSDEAQPKIAATPGLVQAGRFFSVDNFDLIDWAFVDERLAQDGVFGFRMMSATRIEDIRLKLGPSYRVDVWSVCRADRTAATRACTAILKDDIPGGLTRVNLTADPGDDAVGAIQTCMAENGIAPFSGAMLAGNIVPAVTIALADAQGHVVATAHANMPFNTHSKHSGTAWVGLIAVAAQQRGKGLGRLINALAVRAAFETLGADEVVEFVHADNIISRRMIEACGLRLDPSILCGLATPIVDARFTT